MKKLFSLSWLAVFAFVCGISANAEELTYQSIGYGHMTEDMITDLLYCKPITYEVEIEQATDGSANYRVLAPYGQAFADALEEACGLILKDSEFDSEGKCHIDIDATNPDDVIFHKTMTGCDIGLGEMFIGVNSDYNLTLKDKIISGPMLSVAVGYGDSAYAGNRRGKFRIALPGAVLSDYEISLSAEHCLTDRTFKASINVGSDVNKVRYAVMSDWQEDELIKTVKKIAESGAVFGPRGEFSYDMGEVYKETLIVVALDDEGNQVGYDWFTYYFIDENPDGWEDCGMAEYTDGILQDMISNIPSQTTQCMLQRSKAEPNRYRLVNPYSGLNEYAQLNKGHEGHNHYIYINAGDPECIYIEESPVGMQSAQYGLMRISSAVDYYLHAGFGIDDCKELEYGAIIEDGVMTFPEEAMLFSMLNYDNGDWWTVNSAGLTAIKLPEGFSFTAGINDIVTDSPAAPVEYFDLQGIRVDRPEPGRLYIRREGTKVSKEIIL